MAWASQFGVTGRPTKRAIRQGKAGNVLALTTEQIRALNEAEANTSVQLRADSTMQTGFTEYKSYSQRLAGMTAGERDAELAEIKEEAAGIVDPYYNRQEKILKENLQVRLRQLDEQFGLFKEQEKYNLDQIIQNLDLETAESLSSNLEDLQRRGALDSGSMQRVARELIESRGRSIDFEKTTAEFRGREATMGKEHGEELMEKGTALDVEKLGLERERETGKQFFGMLSEEELKAHYAQQDATTRYQPEQPKPTETPAPAPSNILGRTTPETPSGWPSWIGRLPPSSQPGRPAAPQSDIKERAWERGQQRQISSTSNAAAQRLLQSAAIRRAARRPTQVTSGTR